MATRADIFKVVLMHTSATACVRAVTNACALRYQAEAVERLSKTATDYGISRPLMEYADLGSVPALEHLELPSVESLDIVPMHPNHRSSVNVARATNLIANSAYEQSKIMFTSALDTFKTNMSHVETHLNDIKDSLTEVSLMEVKNNETSNAIAYTATAESLRSRIADVQYTLATFPTETITNETFANIHKSIVDMVDVMSKYTGVALAGNSIISIATNISKEHEITESLLSDQGLSKSEVVDIAKCAIDLLNVMSEFVENRDQFITSMEKSITEAPYDPGKPDATIMPDTEEVVQDTKEEIPDDPTSDDTVTDDDVENDVGTVEDPDESVASTESFSENTAYYAACNLITMAVELCSCGTNAMDMVLGVSEYYTTSQETTAMNTLYDPAEFEVNLSDDLIEGDEDEGTDVEVNITVNVGDDEDEDDVGGEESLRLEGDEVEVDVEVNVNTDDGDDDDNIDGELEELEGDEGNEAFNAILSDVTDGDGEGTEIEVNVEINVDTGNDADDDTSEDDDSDVTEGELEPVDGEEGNESFDALLKGLK